MNIGYSEQPALKKYDASSKRAGWVSLASYLTKNNGITQRDFATP